MQHTPHEQNSTSGAMLYAPKDINAVLHAVCYGAGAVLSGGEVK